MTAPHDPGGGPALRPERPEFLVSLGLLAGFTVVVVGALALDGNRTKALRVRLAAATYLFILAATWIAGRSAAARSGEAPASPSAPAFLIAGGAAGLVSGIARPEISAPVAVAQTLGGALLLGGFHFGAVRLWRRLRDFLTGPPGHLL